MPITGDSVASTHPHAQRLLTEHRWCGGQQEQNELVGHKMSVQRLELHALSDLEFHYPAIFFSFCCFVDRLGEHKLTPRSLH